MQSIDPCGVIPGQEAFEMAVTSAELGFGAVNMFIIVSVAFVGWLLAEKTVISTPRLSGLRIWLAIGYFASAGSLGYGAVSLFGRGAAALKFALETARSCGHADDSLLLMVYETGSDWTTKAAICATMLAALWVILFFKSTVQNDGNSKLSIG